MVAPVRDPNRKVIYMLWTVIVVLIIGGAIGGFMLARKTDELNENNTLLIDNNRSLRNQLTQTRSTPSPTASPTASVTPSPSASPVTTPTASPASTKSPTPAP